MEIIAKISHGSKMDQIYLPKNREGRTDISPILALGAERHQEEARRYIVYQKMLKRLEK